MPGFQTKPLTIAIVSGNDSRIIPRNIMACFTHCSAKADFKLLKLETALNVPSDACKTDVLFDPDILSRNHRVV